MMGGSFDQMDLDITVVSLAWCLQSGVGLSQKYSAGRERK